jgi:cell fate regulator YaaT (PSP1 superfamily)
MATATCANRFKIVGDGEAKIMVRVVMTGETHVSPVPQGVTVTCSDYVIIPTKYGRDLARVVGPVDGASAREHGESVAIHRVATPSDVERFRENQERSNEALAVCRERVAEHGLDMSLVQAHFVLDEPRLVFFFTAETRVDFRDLVKDLVHEFRLRIELRQVGVRDEARIVGGLGVCGRVLCCNGVSDRLKAVSIKMAKVQGLSLNSMKISGPCGRLLCCLEYEYDFYREAKRGLPNVGARIRVDDDLLRITEVNVLTNQIRIEGEGRSLVVPTTGVCQEPRTKRWMIRPEEDAVDHETEEDLPPVL